MAKRLPRSGRNTERHTLHVRLMREENEIVKEHSKNLGISKTIWVRMLIRREGGLGSMLPPTR